MNKFFSGIVLCLGLLSVGKTHAQMLYPVPDVENEQLKGSVKTLTVYHVNASPLYTEDEINAYRRKGQKVPSTRNDLFVKTDYNSAGFITSRVYYSSNEENDKTVKTYDASGRLTRETVYRDGALATVYTFDYDASGRPAKARKVDDKGMVIFTEDNTFTFDGDETTQENVHTSARGQKSVSRIVFGPNHRMKSMYVETNGAPSQMIIFDSECKPTEITSYRPAKQTVKFTHGRNSMIRDVFDGSGVATGRSVDELDAHGNVLKTTATGPDNAVPKTKSYTYQYDSHGNWVSKIPAEPTWRDPVIVREIVYYP